MKVFTKVAAVAAVVLAVCMAVSCNLFNPLYGTKWSATDPDSGVIIEFSFTSMSDVTLSASVSGLSFEYTGTYTYDSGTVTITMTVNGEESTGTGTLDGDTLTFEGTTFTKE